MEKHWHRNGSTLYLNGVLYFGCLESKNLYVGVNGTFITQQNTDGKYRGGLRGGTRTRYYKIHINKKDDAYAHRIVFEVCSGTEIQEGLEIDHINGDSLDNRIENLKIVTHKENVNNPITVIRSKNGIEKRRCNEEWKKKISIGRRSFYKTDKGIAFIKKLSEERKGIKLSEERRRKLKEIGETHKIPIIGKELATGRIVKFKSQEDAGFELKICPSLINQQIHGKQKQTHGWIFKYLENQL